MGEAMVLPRTVHCGHVTPQRQWRCPRHVHDAIHEMIVVVAGALQVRFVDQTQTAAADEILLYPRGAVHQEEAVGDGLLETYFMGWTPDAESDPAPTWPRRVRDRDGRIATLARWMHEICMSGSVGDQGMLCDMMGLVLFAYDAAARHAASEDLGARVKACILQHLGEPLRLADLAGFADMSPFHFAREFRRTTGETPMACVRRLRIQAARSLLLSTPLPLKEVAGRVGFGDEYLFSRAFKHLSGVPPGAFRRAWRGGSQADPSPRT